MGTGRSSGRCHAARARRGGAHAGCATLVALAALLGGCDPGGGAGAAAGTDGTAARPPPSDAPGALPRADIRGIDEVYPYRPDGAYAGVLKRCALVDDAADACPLETLPFIAQSDAVPSVEAIMARVLVTHEWMGERLETLLRGSPPELIALFGATTSIVVGSTVRPSNYWIGTGGIQLDPIELWLSVAEKRNVSTEQDYRSPYGRRLSFRFLAARRIGARPASARFELEDDTERTLADIVVPITGLLFHELAHANDFLPPGNAAFLDTALPPFEALLAIETAWLSPQLDAERPLGSSLLRELAQVRFGGEEPTDAERGVTADVAGVEMAGDGATHFYSYTTIREDFANLLEIAMLKATHDVDTHVGFTNQPADFERFGCDELVVAWGVRNRLGDPAVAARARWVIERLYGGGDALEALIAGQSGTQSAMTTGVDWCTNRDAGATALAKGSGGTEGDDGLGPERLSAAERHALLAARRRGTTPY